MSLFERNEYQWRETFFILFREPDQPSAERIQQALQQLDPRFVLRDIRKDQDDRFESLTLEAPDDYSAMDITLVRGEEVIEQTAELMKEMLKGATSSKERDSIRELAEYRSRYDVYHFEQLVFVGRESDDDELDDFMDPGAVLTVMQRVAELCRGVVIDPQAFTIL